MTPVPQSTLSLAKSRRGGKEAPISYPTAQGKEALLAAFLLVVVGIVLPYFIHIVGASPRVFLPMHYVAFLAGVILSPLHAMSVGLATPAISMGLTGFPTSAQVMRMMPEMAAYAGVMALMLRLLPCLPGLPARAGRIAAIAVAVLAAMIVGRVVYIAFYLLTVGPESVRFFVNVLVAPAVPGLIAQIIIVPLLADRLQRSL